MFLWILLTYMKLLPGNEDIIIISLNNAINLILEFHVIILLLYTNISMTIY